MSANKSGALSFAYLHNIVGSFGLTVSRGRRRSVRDPTAVSRAVRVTASLPSRDAELIVSNAGSIDTRTDIQQANGFLLAQESVAACDGVG
jgi:hypothetical protein